MKLIGWHPLVDQRFSRTREFGRVQRDVVDGLAAVQWPPGSGAFTLHPGRNVNGVTPIKEAFIALLQARGWVPEFHRFDAHLTFSSNVAPFAIEWETGNISSSHRAINRMALGMLEDRISGGILVVPSRNMYFHLTDRIGNFAELKPYLELWREWSKNPKFSYLAIVEVEHDSLDAAVPVLAKGTDGRALL